VCFKILDARGIVTLAAFGIVTLAAFGMSVACVARAVEFLSGVTTPVTLVCGGHGFQGRWTPP